MIIRHVNPEETEAWLGMRMALWPETEGQLHRKEMAMMLSDARQLAVFVCEDPDGSLVGFAETSLREWAEGCSTSPVGYLEGWYVAPHARRRGVGTALLRAAEEWARARGCVEMASDTELGNEASEVAHRKLGYQVAARVVAFRKRLG
jgi:aminoglycoside 6'-N-acetyltransferase I